MIEGLRIEMLDVKRDERGWLSEILRSSGLPPGVQLAQLFMTVGNPGKSKGKHFHRRKTEWFSVVSGEATLVLHDTRTGEEQAIAMGERNMVTVMIPPHVAHAITCVGDKPFFLLVVVSEEFDLQDPDTFAFDFPNL